MTEPDASPAELEARIAQLEADLIAAADLPVDRRRRMDEIEALRRRLASAKPSPDAAMRERELLADLLPAVFGGAAEQDRVRAAIDSRAGPREAAALAAALALALDIEGRMRLVAILGDAPVSDRLADRQSQDADPDRPARP